MGDKKNSNFVWNGDQDSPNVYDPEYNKYKWEYIKKEYTESEKKIEASSILIILGAFSFILGIPIGIITGDPVGFGVGAILMLFCWFISAILLITA